MTERNVNVVGPSVDVHSPSVNDFIRIDHNESGNKPAKGNQIITTTTTTTIKGPRVETVEVKKYDILESKDFPFDSPTIDLGSGFTRSPSVHEKRPVTRGRRSDDPPGSVTTRGASFSRGDSNIKSPRVAVTTPRDSSFSRSDSKIENRKIITTTPRQPSFSGGDFSKISVETPKVSGLVRSDSKIGNQKVTVMKPDIHAPTASLHLNNGVSKVSVPKVSIPNASISVPNTNLNSSVSTVSGANIVFPKVEGPSLLIDGQPGFEIQGQTSSVNISKPHLNSGGHISTQDVTFPNTRAPSLHFDDQSNGAFNFHGPDLSVNLSNLNSGVHMTTQDVAFPNTRAPSILLGGSKNGSFFESSTAVNVPSFNPGVHMSAHDVAFPQTRAPSLHLDGPSIVHSSVRVPNASVNVTNPTVTDTGFKIPNPFANISKPDISILKPDLGFSTTNASVNIPNANLNAGMSVTRPKLDLTTDKSASFHIDHAEDTGPIFIDNNSVVDISNPMHISKHDVVFPKARAPSLHIGEPKVASSGFNIPNPFANITKPNLSVLKPDINAPKIEIPSQNITKPSVKVQGQSVNSSTHLTSGSVNIPNANLNTDLTIPNSGISIPKPNISIPKPNIQIPKPDITLPKLDIHIPKPDITLPKIKAPSLGGLFSTSTTDAPNANLSAELTGPESHIHIDQPHVNIGGTVPHVNSSFITKNQGGFIDYEPVVYRSTSGIYQPVTYRSTSQIPYIATPSLAPPDVQEVQIPLMIRPVRDYSMGIAQTSEIKNIGFPIHAIHKNKDLFEYQNAYDYEKTREYDSNQNATPSLAPLDVQEIEIPLMVRPVRDYSLGMAQISEIKNIGFPIHAIQKNKDLFEYQNVYNYEKTREYDSNQNEFYNSSTNLLSTYSTDLYRNNSLEVTDQQININQPIIESSSLVITENESSKIVVEKPVISKPSGLLDVVTSKIKMPVIKAPVINTQIFQTTESNSKISSANVDVPSIDIPKANLSTPSVVVQNEGIDISRIVRVETETKTVKLEGPNLDLHGDKLDVKGAQLNIKGPKIKPVEVNIKKPHLEVHETTVSGPNIDINGPNIKPLKVDLKATNVELHEPILNVQGPKIKPIDIHLQESHIDVQGPKLNQADIKLQGPHLDVNTPVLQGQEINLHGLQIKPVKIDIKESNIDLKGPNLNVQGPKIKPIEVHPKDPQVEVHVPNVNIEGPHVKPVNVNLREPSFDLHGPTINLKETKVKPIDVNMRSPHLDVHGPLVDVSTPKLKTTDVNLRGSHIEVGTAHVSPVEINIGGPHVDLNESVVKVQTSKIKPLSVKESNTIIKVEEITTKVNHPQPAATSIVVTEPGVELRSERSRIRKRVKPERPPQSVRYESSTNDLFETDEEEEMRPIPPPRSRWNGRQDMESHLTYYPPSRITSIQRSLLNPYNSNNGDNPLRIFQSSNEFDLSTDYYHTDRGRSRSRETTLYSRQEPLYSNTPTYEAAPVDYWKPKPRVNKFMDSRSWSPVQRGVTLSPQRYTPGRGSVNVLQRGYTPDSRSLSPRRYRTEGSLILPDIHSTRGVSRAAGVTDIVPSVRITPVNETFSILSRGSRIGYYGNSYVPTGAYDVSEYYH